jgi:hypothetical protein
VTSRPSWHGSPPPTSATPRTDRATFGTDVADTARILGVPFMGWQSLAADRALCAVCNAPLPERSGPGRPPTYCSRRFASAAERARTARRVLLGTLVETRAAAMTHGENG